jgi:hypothetical protein
MLNYAHKKLFFKVSSSLSLNEEKNLKLADKNKNNKKWQVIKIFTLLLTSRLSSLESHNRKHIEITLTTDVDKDNLFNYRPQKEIHWVHLGRLIN